jgi:hypothetical protein
MSYEYSDVDQHEALYSLARRYPGNIDALAQAMGRRQGKQVSPNVLRNKLRPGIDSHILGAEEFSLVVELCEEAGVECAKGPVQALCWRHGLVAVSPPAPDTTARDVVAELGVVSREFADLVAEVGKDAFDGEISPDECAHIRKEALELMQAVMALTLAAEAAANRSKAGCA